MFESCACYNSILNHLIYLNQMIFGTPPPPPSQKEIDWDILTLDL